MDLLTLTEKGARVFPNQCYAQGVKDKKTACALTTMHAGYALENGETLKITDGAVLYVPQVHNLSHPLNYQLCQYSVNVDNLPTTKDKLCIEKVMKRFGYLPLRWGVVSLNDQCKWDRKEIGRWAKKHLRDD